MSGPTRLPKGTALAVLALALGCGRAPGPRPSAATATRIASKAVLGDEILWSLGPAARARTVAVSGFADDSRYSALVGTWPADLPRLGDNPAEALALAPDLLVVATFTDAQYREALEGLVPMVELRGFTGFEAYLDNVRRVAAVIGETEAAERLARAFERRIAALAEHRPTPAPTCLSWGHGSVPAAETTFDAAAQAAGCRNVPAAAGLVGHRRVDAEQVVAWDPDFIVLSCRDGFGAGALDPCEAARRDFTARPGFATLRAVQADQVILVPPPLLSSTGSGMADLAERLQADLRARLARPQPSLASRPVPPVQPATVSEPLDCDSPSAP